MPVRCNGEPGGSGFSSTVQFILISYPASSHVKSTPMTSKGSPDVTFQHLPQAYTNPLGTIVTAIIIDTVTTSEPKYEVLFI
ncbi:MAG: hypothetical protein AB7V56_06385 [Candidatus Nitrosocosmicus sp.]